MSTSKRLDLQTLGSQSVNARKCPDFLAARPGSQPIMPKNTPAFLAAVLAARTSTIYAQQSPRYPDRKSPRYPAARKAARSSTKMLTKYPDTRQVGQRNG
jgi:hypothetical protein